MTVKKLGLNLKPNNKVVSEKVTKSAQTKMSHQTSPGGGGHKSSKGRGGFSR